MGRSKARVPGLGGIIEKPVKQHALEVLEDLKREKIKVDVGEDDNDFVGKVLDGVLKLLDGKGTSQAKAEYLSENSLIKEFANRFPLKKLISTSLSEGLIDTENLNDGQKKHNAKQLFENIRDNFTFSYGQGTSDIVCLLTGTGDCGSLANMYCSVAQAYKFDAKREPQGLMVKHLVRPLPIKGRDKESNTDAKGLLFWYFGSHFWVTAEGTTYDLLFMKEGGLKEGTDFYLEKEKFEHKGVNCIVFGNDHCVIHSSENEKLKSKGRTETALVFRNKKDTRAHIDTYIK